MEAPKVLYQPQCGKLPRVGPRPEGSRLRCCRVIHVKSPKKTNKDRLTLMWHGSLQKCEGGGGQTKSGLTVVYLNLIDSSDFVHVLSNRAKHSH